MISFLPRLGFLFEVYYSPSCVLDNAQIYINYFALLRRIHTGAPWRCCLFFRAFVWWSSFTLSPLTSSTPCAYFTPSQRNCAEPFCNQIVSHLLCSRTMRPVFIYVHFCAIDFAVRACVRAWVLACACAPGQTSWTRFLCTLSLFNTIKSASVGGGRRTAGMGLLRWSFRCRRTRTMCTTWLTGCVVSRPKKPGLECICTETVKDGRSTLKKKIII